MIEDFPAKPEGMHWQTYLRLSQEEQAHSKLYFLGLAKKFKELKWNDQINLLR
jgi:hypothetical protein